MKKMKLPPKSVAPMAADSMADMQQPAGQPMAAPAAPAMPAAPAAPAISQKTHNPDNLLPGHAFHGKRR